MAIDKKTNTNVNRTTYKCYPANSIGTINNGTANLPVNFGTLGMGIHVTVTNYNSQSGNLGVKLNFNTNDTIFVAPGKVLTFDDEKITRIFLSNASGAAITYQGVILGG